MTPNQLDEIEFHFKAIMEAMDLDLNDPNFVETPRRVAKAYNEIFAGLSVDADAELERLLGVTFPAEYNEMILVKNIKAWGMCPHHFLPVEMDINFAYIPDNSVIGLSKMPRAIQLLAAKPILQEQLTTDIVDTFEKCLKPKGVIVQVVGQHMCMKVRGVKSHSSDVTTTAFLGCFENQTSRSEFFSSIK